MMRMEGGECRLSRVLAWSVKFGGMRWGHLVKSLACMSG